MNANRWDYAAGGNIELYDAALTSNGGNIIMGGQGDPATMPTQGYTGAYRGVVLDNTTVTAGSGDISIRGKA